MHLLTLLTCVSLSTNTQQSCGHVWLSQNYFHSSFDMAMSRMTRSNQSVSAASIQLRTDITKITVHGRPQITLLAGNPDDLAHDRQFHSSACVHVLLVESSGLVSFNIRGSPLSAQNPLTSSAHDPTNIKPCSYHTRPLFVKLSGLWTGQWQADDLKKSLNLLLPTSYPSSSV